MKQSDWIGTRHGRLVVTSMYSKTKNGIRWNCLCVCGKSKIIYATALRSGNTKSCGCLSREIHPTIHQKHGDAKRKKTREYIIWGGIKHRCLNPKCKQFADYGGRGISIYPEWIESYSSFLAHMGRAPSNDHSVDRIDNNKGYEPGNVRWATRSQQQSNRRSNVIIEHKGVKKTLTEWTKILNISMGGLLYRVKIGKPLDDPKIIRRPKMLTS